MHATLGVKLFRVMNPQKISACPLTGKAPWQNHSCLHFTHVFNPLEPLLPAEIKITGRLNNIKVADTKGRCYTWHCRVADAKEEIKRSCRKQVLKDLVGYLNLEYSRPFWATWVHRKTLTQNKAKPKKPHIGHLKSGGTHICYQHSED